MTKEFINPEGLAEPAGWTHVVTAEGGKLVFIAGMVAMAKNGKIVGKGNIAAQARKTFENLKVALASVGASPKDMVQMRYYLKDYKPEFLPVIRKARMEVLSLEKSPASALIGVPVLFLDDLLIEVEAVAVVE